MSQPVDTAYVEIRPDLDRFGAQLARRLTAALNRVQADVDRSGERMSASLGRAGAEGGQRFGNNFTRDATQGLTSARGRFADEGNRSADAFGDAFVRSLGRHLVRLTSVATAAGSALTTALRGTVGLAGIAGAVGAASAAIAGLASAAGAALPVIGALATTLATASGTLLAYPGAIAVVQTAIGTLRIAFLGFGEALKESLKGSDKAAEAMEKLAPAAQKLVKAIVDLKPEWEGLQKAVQQTTFAGLAAIVNELARSSLPTLRAGFVGVAQVINGQLRAALGELSTLQTRLRLDTIFDNTRRALANLTPAIGPLIAALLNVADVGSTVVADLTAGLGDWISGLANQLSDLAKSGDLRLMIEDGLNVLAQFGRAAADVAGIVKGIFTAAGSGGEGAGILGFLDRLNELVNSVAGQDALTSLFSNLAVVGDALSPVLLAVGQALGPVSAGIAQIAVAAGPGLTTVVAALGQALASLAPGFISLLPLVSTLATGLQPVADILVNLVTAAAPGLDALLQGLVAALQALAPAAAPVGQALGAVVQAIAPMLSVVGAQLGNLLTVLATALSTVAAQYGPLIGVFGQLATSVATQFLPVILQLGQQLLPVMAQAGAQVAAAFAPLIPVFSQVASILVTQLSAALPQLIASFQQMLPSVVSLAQTLGQQLLVALQSLIPQLPGLIGAGLQLAIAFSQIVAAVYPLLPQLIQLAVLAVGAMVNSGLLAGSIRNMAVAMTVAAGIVRTVGAVVSALVGPMATAAAAAARLGAAIRAGTNQALAAVRSLPGQIRGALGNVGDILYSAGRSIIQGLINGMRSMLGSVANAASSIASTVKGFFPFSPAKEGPLSGRGNPYYSGRAIGNLLAEGMQSRQQQVADASARLASLVGVSTGAPAVPGMGSATSRPPAAAVTSSGDGQIADVIEQALRRALGGDLSRLLGREIRQALDGLEWRMTDVDRVVSRQIGYAANLSARTGGGY